MTKYNKKSLLGLFILFFIASSMPIFAQGYGVKKIVIDPGHGGNDPGAIGKHCKEKDIVLKVALLLGGYIEKNLDDVEVLYTRSDDTFIPLKDRAKIANKAKADLFISIHANAVGNSSVSGAETFVMGTHKNDANFKLAQKENSVIKFEDNYEEKYEGFDPASAESYMIFSFMQNAYKEQSVTLATLVQDQYTTRVGRHNRKVKEAGFLVLSGSTMPSILTELGFVSNAKEEAFLISKQGQEYLASALFRAVRDYKNEMDAKQSLHITEKEKLKSSPIVEKDRIDSGVVYKLQIFTSSSILPADHASIKGITDVGYYQSGSVYKYTLGYSSDIKNIMQLQNQYKKTFKGCFVIAFKDGKRISLDEAKAILDK